MRSTAYKKIFYHIPLSILCGKQVTSKTTLLLNLHHRSHQVLIKSFVSSYSKNTQINFKVIFSFEYELIKDFKALGGIGGGVAKPKGKYFQRGLPGVM